MPIRGETDLTAEGLWISDGPRSVFVALRLLRCTHPFPFDRLFYRTQSASLRTSRSSSAADSSSKPETAQSAKTATYGGNPQGGDGREDKAQVEAEGVVDSPFPDLLSKPIRRVRTGTSWSQGGTAPDPSLSQLVEVERGDIAAEVVDSPIVEESGLSVPAMLLDVCKTAGELALLNGPEPVLRDDRVNLLMATSGREEYACWWVQLWFPENNGLTPSGVAFSVPSLELQLVLSALPPSCDRNQAEALLRETVLVSAGGSGVPRLLSGDHLALSISDGKLRPELWRSYLEGLGTIASRTPRSDIASADSLRLDPEPL